MHLAIIQHLQEVLGAAQQRIVLRQHPCAIVAEQTRLRQTLDAGGSMPGQHVRMLARVAELQPLHQELDVANPAAAVLDVQAPPQPARTRRRRRSGGVRVPHPGDRRRHLGVAEPAADGRLQAFQQPFPERDVAGDDPAAQQRLRLP